MHAEPAPPLSLHPIGVFHCEERYPYDAARQGVLADNVGEVRLHPGNGYELALRDLEGFSHLWVLFWFDRNPQWQPLVSPPRGDRRVGVFASRSPHRPNPIGLSLVRLVGIQGGSVRVGGHDLLDGTPVLDLKPYVAYADSAPDARMGWLEESAGEAEWRVTFAPAAQAQLDWLAQRGLTVLEGFLRRELAWRPTDDARKRVKPLGTNDRWELAYRTWRAEFEADAAARTVRVLRIRSGYTAADLAADAPDRYGDHALHREFRELVDP